MEAYCYIDFFLCVFYCAAATFSFRQKKPLPGYWYFYSAFLFLGLHHFSSFFLVLEAENTLWQITLEFLSVTSFNAALLLLVAGLGFAAGLLRNMQLWVLLTFVFAGVSGFLNLNDLLLSPVEAARQGEVGMLKEKSFLIDRITKFIHLLGYLTIIGFLIKGRFSLSVIFGKSYVNAALYSGLLAVVNALLLLMFPVHLLYYADIPMFFIAFGIFYFFFFRSKGMQNFPPGTNMLFEKMPAAVMISDVNMKITYVNQELLRLTGYKLQDFVNNSLTEVINRLAFDGYQDNLFSDNGKVNITRAEKQRKLVNWKTEKVYGEDNEVLGTISIITDLDELAEAEEKLRMANEGLRKEVKLKEKQLQFAQRRLESRDARYSYIFDNQASVMLLIDPDHFEIQTANKAALKYYGYSEKQMTGMDLFKINPDDRMSIIRFCQNAREYGKTNHVMEHLLADGSRRTVEVHTNPIFNEGKCLIYAVIQDVTDKRLSEVNLRKLSRAVEQSPVSVVITNASGFIEYVNNKFTEVSGYLPEEVIGQKPNIYRDDSGSNIDYQQLWATISSGKEWRGDFSNRRKNGEMFYESAVISPVKDDNNVITHFVAVKEDITEQKLIKERYKTAQKQLNVLSGQIKDAREEERMFISRELHDSLGQSLTALRMELFSLKKKMDSGRLGTDELVSMNNEIINYVDFIIRSVRRISRSLRPDMVLDKGLIKAVKWLVQDLDKRSEIKLSFYSGLSELDMDGSHAIAIYRIIQEAITNAIRHSGASEINVNIEQHSNGLICSVADNGRGFRPEEKKSNKSIGLQTMQERAEILNASIEIDSAIGKGTKVKLVLSQINQSKCVEC